MPGEAAQTILKMIEAVDPADTATLDEIDARVWCLCNEARFKRMLSTPENYKHGYFSYYQGSLWGSKAIYPPMYYTRSRDALKSIRPEGWSISIENDGTCDCFMTHRSGPHHQVSAPTDRLLPTEELAELHAIIQAIDYDRSQKESAA